MSERSDNASGLALEREGKPRDKGLTFAIDRMGVLNRELLQQSAEYVDYVKIGLSYPLLLDRTKLIERIRFYHDIGLKVQSGGTLIQVAYKKRILSQVLERLHSLGFDTVEISESATDIPRDAKEEIVNTLKRLSMDYVFEVGRNDPVILHQLRI